MNLADLIAETMLDAHRARLGVCIYCGHTKRSHLDNTLGHDYWDGKS